MADDAQDYSKCAKLKVALVHDWLTGMRGGERCLEVFCELFPRAEIYTLVHIRGKLSPTIERMPVHESFVRKLPMVEKRYRHYLPLFPRAIESLKIADCDLVLSSSHCVAKGAIAPPGVPHVCYCFTPMRYVWDLYDDYFGPQRAGSAVRAAMGMVRGRLRKWDVDSAARVKEFVAISDFIADRIRRHYGRESKVIYPPVESGRFSISREVGDYYLVVSALAPYKRVDLAVEACRKLGRRLLVVGTGQDEARLKAIAGPGVEFLGWKSDEEVAALYSRCRAFIFPGVEDFGITPLEAMASGRPVIAYGMGGALETVVEGKTGVFFKKQTAEGLCGAMERFEEIEGGFRPEELRSHAENFDTRIFKRRIAEFVTAMVG
ncbi:MAG TPA: glycosyltransferase [Candidatus Brocadiia bacterium]|nr:glycosyltransferase [Candidatus Brocadiia bacterium]